MIPQDYHVHTNFSCDSEATMAEMCRAALDNDIPEIGFSEHFDLISEDHGYNFFNADAWWETLRSCRDAFRGLLTIRAGIEIGEPHRFQNPVRKLLEGYPWDYCLGALHWIDSNFVLSRSYFENFQEQAFHNYFVELQRMISLSDFDILAHMDIVKRYGYDVYGFYDPHPYEGEIRAVLRKCVKKGLALEVNTSTLRRPVGETSPSQTVLTWYLEEGGQWVVLGSDAHKPEQVGFGLEKALATLRDVGFNNLARYETRQMSPFPLQSPEQGS